MVFLIYLILILWILSSVLLLNSLSSYDEYIAKRIKLVPIATLIQVGTLLIVLMIEGRLTVEWRVVSTIPTIIVSTYLGGVFKGWWNGFVSLHPKFLKKEEKEKE